MDWDTFAQAHQADEKWVSRLGSRASHIHLVYKLFAALIDQLSLDDGAGAC